MIAEYSRGRHARALIRYEIAADMGSLLAQRNAAFLYEHKFGLSGISPTFATPKWNTNCHIMNKIREG